MQIEGSDTYSARVSLSGCVDTGMLEILLCSSIIVYGIELVDMELTTGNGSLVPQG